MTHGSRLACVLAAGLVVSVVPVFAQPEPLSLQAPQSITPSRHGFEAFEITPNIGALRRAAGEFSITLPGGQTVVLQRIATEDRGGGELFWHGRVLLDLGSEVALTVKHGLVAGAIRTSTDVYELRPERGRHVIERQNRASFPPGADPIAPAAGALSEPAVAADGVAEIHLMSLYTPQARDLAGGVAGIESQIQAAIDNANLAFNNSGVAAHYTLVYTGLTSHNDSADMGTDLTWLQADATVASLRNQYGADMVSLIVGNNISACGIGYVMRTVGSSFAQYAFQVTGLPCAVGNLTFAHEHGHNLGMEHDPANGTTPASASYPWSFGHFVNGSFRTVMSYSSPCTSGCTRVAYFSNPGVTYLGQPTGIIDQRDNARTGNSTTPVVAAFRAASPTSPPAAPTGLGASAASTTQINLAWTDNSSNESNFLIERGTDGVNFAQIASVAANVATYQNTGLTAATTYHYRVRATNASGNSAYTNTASATTNTPQPPAAPTGLGASPASTTQINLTWTDNATNESNFLVERGTDGVNFTQIASLGANVVGYSSTGLTEATTYFFRVRASNASGNSAYTNTASATTNSPQPPAAPSSLAASPVSSTQINLTWTDNATNETGFLIERSIGGGGFSQIASVGANAIAYSNTGLTGGTAYSYRVRATNGDGQSAYSNTASATTPAGPPAAPSALTATVLTTGSGKNKVFEGVRLNWTDNSTNETTFQIDRCKVTGNGSNQTCTYAGLISIAGSATTGARTHTDLPATFPTSNPAGTYRYRLTAVNGAGTSAAVTASANVR